MMEIRHIYKKTTTYAARQLGKASRKLIKVLKEELEKMFLFRWIKLALISYLEFEQALINIRLILPIQKPSNKLIKIVKAYGKLDPMDKKIFVDFLEMERKKP